MEKFGESFTESIGEPEDEIEEVELHIGTKEKTVRIGTRVEAGIRERMICLLREFLDIFVWSLKDMPGIPDEIAVHRLGVNKEKRPLRQKKRNHALERQKAIDEEVD